MKQLTQFETQIVAGGAGCIDAAIFQNVQARAKSEAIEFAGMVDVLLMAGAYGLTKVAMGAAFSVGAGLGAAAVVGFVAAPWLAIAGYTNSSAWNILNVQAA